MHGARSKRNTFRQGLRFGAGLCLLLHCAFAIPADEISPEHFLAQAFESAPPPAEALWFTGERAAQVAAILGHAPGSLRTRYWQDGERTVWILNEIGREKPITAGFVVENGKLKDVRVLAFRESRGWEIRQPFFVRQFQGLHLDASTRLSAPIDNITGATLSVNAMRRMARLALFLDGEVRDVAP